MIVVCITDNTGDHGKRPKVTIGKSYIAFIKDTDPSNPYYIITTDDGERRVVDVSWFVDPDEYRERQLNKILI